MKVKILTATALAVLLVACVSDMKYDNLQQQYEQLEASFSQDQAQITLLEGKLKVTMLDQILFSEGGYKLNLFAQGMLSKLVPTLVALEQTRVVVAGYTDNVPIGSGLKREGISSNLDLSSKRADGVVNYFISQGVNPDIISAQGFGDSHPVAGNDTPGGRTQNRRIEITLVGTGK